MCVHFELRAESMRLSSTFSSSFAAVFSSSGGRATWHTAEQPQI